MSEKEPEFVVTDRRKFNLEGDLREDAPKEQEWASTPILTSKDAGKKGSTGGKDAVKEPQTGDLSQPAASKAAPNQSTEAQTHEAGDISEDELPQPPTAAESAEANEVYTASARQLDEVVRAANPGMPPVPAMDFARLVQSLYMSALVQMGAGTQEGQKPRLDILGARQTIDMLGVLSEKTSGNLTPDETSFLQSALFELRMAFLEITQAIARNATQQAAAGATPPKGTGKPTLVR